MSPTDGLEPEEVLRRALAGVDALVTDTVPLSAWSHPSPCPGWSARTVLGHLIDGGTQISGLLRGHPLAAQTDLGALDRLVGPDPAGAWARAHHQLLDALADDHSGGAPPRVLDTARGPAPRDQLLLAAAIEPLVHQCDIARALDEDRDQAEQLDLEVVEALLPGIRALGPDLAATGMYAPALATTTDMTPQQQLLAAVGRTP